MRNVFETLLHYLHHTWTDITWLGEAVASVKYGADKELQDYLGAAVASAGYVGAAYGMDYIDNVDLAGNTEKALQSVMHYLPPQAALWVGKLVSSFVTKSIFGLMF
ncbi:hypothetical protein E2C01_071860 [Portunus trituberculatus]|uniref:Uncharacterized protein n=1 Tax=Portunus trituberculatus TaxID=210409 RepID=A0A5B7I7D8_PORTR|nr:hypothetical protein [Portunus trituberculatus]